METLTCDTSIEELLAVINKYWSEAKAEITETISDNGIYDYLSLNFDFVDNYDSAHFPSGKLVFRRPQIEAKPHMVADVLSAEKCQNSDHLMKLDSPCW